MESLSFSFTRKIEKINLINYTLIKRYFNFHLMSYVLLSKLNEIIELFAHIGYFEETHYLMITYIHTRFKIRKFYLKFIKPCSQSIVSLMDSYITTSFNYLKQNDLYTYERYKLLYIKTLVNRDYCFTHKIEKLIQ